MKRAGRAAGLAGALAAALGAQQGDRAAPDKADLPPDLAVPPAIVRSPADEAATFRLMDGLCIELAAAEPLVADPVAAVFDAAGRLWVVEMRSFMRDVDGRGELEPDGRIVVLEDADGDGRVDRGRVFLDRLVLPRAVLPLEAGALVIAPPHLLWVEDRDQDLVPERTTELAAGFAAGLDNPEHAGNGLLWGLDNRIHLADDARLWRWTPAGFRVETGAGGGQWGISQDDRGRMYFDYNEDWLRCDLVPGRYVARAPEQASFAGGNHRLARDESVFPIHVTPGVNRGGRPGILENGVLVRHTAACAPLVYRGDLLPACYGDVFACEPAGNLVRRFRLADQDGSMRAANAYDHAEFLASTDERFRPVNLAQGPDGALYVVDMYRGVIQHRNFVTTFLRKQIRARGLERPTGLGRIWRIAPPGPQARVWRTPRAASSAQLVAALGERDGWLREQAQMLLVQRQDRAAVPALRALVRRAIWPPARSHALAALAGLGALGYDDLRAVLHGDDPGVLATALGYVAPWLERGDDVLWSQCERLASHEAPAVRWHLALALGDVHGARGERALRLLAACARPAPGDAVLRDCLVNAAAGREPALARALASALPGAAAAPLLRALAREVGRARTAGRTQDLLDVAAACMHEAQQQALLQGLLDALPREQERQRGFFVFAATPPALPAIVRTGAPEVARLVQRILAATELRPEAVPPAPEPWDAGLDPAERARVAAGERIYRATCAACHQPNGRGMQGLAPPLRDSEWVTGPPERLIKVALHGVRGPLTAAGVAHDGEMPGQGHLSDGDLAAVLSWLRRAWDHGREPIAPGAVAAVRAANKDRSSTFSADELLRQ